MPTDFTERGFRFFFFPSDGKEPAHVHVAYNGRGAKIWILPVALERNYGLRKHELHFSLRLARKYEKKIKQKWDEFFKDYKP